MSHGYYHTHRNEKAETLTTTYPNAALILSLIAQRARWTPDTNPINGLGHMECFISSNDFKGSRKGRGMTRQQFRSALNFLLDSGFATKLSTNRTTNEAYRIKLIDSSIYDINPKYNNQPINQPINTESTTNQPQKNKERKKELKHGSLQSPSKSVVPKIQVMEFIHLTTEEYEKLKAEFADTLTAMLDTLNSYKGSTGKRYKSDYHTLRGWVKDRVLEEKSRVSALKSIKKAPTDTPQVSFIEKARNFANNLCREIVEKAKAGKIRVPKDMKFMVENDHVTVGLPGGAAGDWTLRFDAYGFEEQLNSRCRKLGLI